MLLQRLRRPTLLLISCLLLGLTATVNTSCGCNDWDCPSNWFSSVRLEFTLLDSADPNDWNNNIVPRPLIQGAPAIDDTLGVWVEVVEDGGHRINVRNNDFGGSQVGDIEIIRGDEFAGEATELPISTVRLAIHQRDPQAFNRTDSIVFRGGLTQEATERRCCDDLTYFVIEAFRMSFARNKVQGDHTLPPGRSTNRNSIFSTIALR